MRFSPSSQLAFFANIPDLGHWSACCEVDSSVEHFVFFQIILPGRSGAKGTALLDVFFFANYPLSWALLALLQSGQFSTTVIFSNKIDYSGFVCCKQDGPVGRFCLQMVSTLKILWPVAKKDVVNIIITMMSS